MSERCQQCGSELKQVSSPILGDRLICTYCTSASVNNTPQATHNRIFGISERYRDASFETFDASLAPEYADNLSKVMSSMGQKQGMVFMGGPGLGKTHLSIAVMKYWSQSNTGSGKFIDVAGRLHEHKSSNFSAMMFPPLGTFTVLDDMDKVANQKWLTSEVDVLINKLYISGKLFVVTCNNTLDVYGDYTRSRLIEMSTVIRFSGPDIRTGGASAEIEQSQIKSILKGRQ